MKNFFNLNMDGGLLTCLIILIVLLFFEMLYVCCISAQIDSVGKIIQEFDENHRNRIPEPVQYAPPIIPDIPTSQPMISPYDE
jgi:hypothetical protein